VCRDLDPRNVDEKKYYHRGDLASLLDNSSACQSCEFLKRGLLRFFGLPELNKYISESEAYHHRLEIWESSKLLEVSLVVWTVAQPPKRMSWRVVKRTLEFYLLPGKNQPITHLPNFSVLVELSRNIETL
jgi:hypothetical protein